MNWLRKWIAAAQDQDKFWAEWHRARRQKSMERWERQRDLYFDRYLSASKMARYFRARLDGDLER